MIINCCHKSRKSKCSLGFYLLNARLEKLNAARMSAAGEGLTEPNLYLRTFPCADANESRHLAKSRRFSY
jgi:hypothetical protein